MSPEESRLLSAALEYLGPQLADAFEDCGVCEVRSPRDKFFATICEDHGVSAEDLAVLLTPGDPRPLRTIARELASALVDQMRAEGVS